MRTAFLFLGAFLLSSLVRADEKKAIFKTPQELFKEVAKASKTNDMVAMAPLLAKKSLERLAGQVVLSSARISSIKPPPNVKVPEKFKKQQEEVASILKKFGLDIEKVKALRPDRTAKGIKRLAPFLNMAKKVKDHMGFVKAFYELVNKARGKQKPRDAKLKLEDVKIKGDIATGNVVVTSGEKTRKQAVTFKKEGKGWKWELPEPKPRPRPTPKPKPEPAPKPVKEKE